MNISTKWQKLVSLSPFDVHEYIFFPTITVYFARDIANFLYSKVFKHASKEAQKLCHIVLCALI